MKIKVNNVHGTTSKKGAKQNKTFTITGNSGSHTDWKGVTMDLSNFHTAIDEKGRKYKIWDVHKNWSEIGIARDGKMTYSYTTDFEIVES